MNMIPFEMWSSSPPARPARRHKKKSGKRHSRSISASSITKLFSSHHPNYQDNPDLPLHIPDHHKSKHSQSSKLAFFARSRLVIGSLLLCAVIALTLASFTSLRFGVQLKYIVGSIFASSRIQLPLSLNPQKGRPITLSPMAPPQYKKPPQAPPVFTATPESLLEDTRRLVCLPTPQLILITASNLSLSRLPRTKKSKTAS
jgi:hypothetical protein